MPKTETQLVKLALASNEKAFSELVNLYADPLVHLAFLRLANLHDAQDVVQEAFMIAYCQLSRLEDTNKFGPWLRGIVANLCCNVLDERRKQSAVREKQALTANRDCPGMPPLEKENQAVLRQAFEALTGHQREVALLRYLHDMKLAVIAGLLARPLGAVKRDLFEARHKLKKELIEMAREEFNEYRLDEESKKRLKKIARFPQMEPKISVVRLNRTASPVRAQNVLFGCPPFEPAAEFSIARYFAVAGAMTGITHCRVTGPETIKEKACFGIDRLVFAPDERPLHRSIFYYVVEKESAFLWARCANYPGKEMRLKTWDDPEWIMGEPDPKPFTLVPNTQTNARNGERFIVDSNYYTVNIGKRSFMCLKRIEVEPLIKVDWNNSPVGVCFGQEFLAEDGRCILWQRYNGELWSDKNPERKGHQGTVENLAANGASKEILDGQTYYHWYDFLPDYVLFN